MIKRVGAQLGEYAACIEIDIRDGRVTDFYPGIADTVEYTGPELSPLRKLDAQVNARTGLVDSEPGGGSVADESIAHGLRDIDSRCEKQSRPPAERLVELRDEQRVGAQLQVGAPLRPSLVEPGPGQSRGNIECRGSFEVVLE